MRQENQPNLKLTEATDPRFPRLDALLDAALAPQAAPEGLTERIVAATAGQLPAARHGQGFGSPMRLLRVAAVIAMAVGLGVVMWSASAPTPTAAPSPVADNDRSAPDTPALDDLERRLARLAADSASLTDDQGWIDDQISMVVLQVELVQTASDWPDEREAIIVTGARYELDQLVDEMSLMF